MPENSVCPDRGHLHQLLTSTLGPQELEPISAHVETCERCQKTLESLLTEHSFLTGLAEQLRLEETPPESALQQVMERVRCATDPGEGSATQAGEAAPHAALPDGLGKAGRLGHYEVIEVVRSGGMGMVFKAFDPALRRVVALKVLAPHLAASATARQRFTREARIAAAVRDDHVVAIHGVDENGDLPYLVMDYIEGVSLQDRLDRGGPLAVEEIVRIGIQAARGLAAAHARGVVHRDIKPANILLEEGSGRARLTDFGLARAADDASLTRSGVIAGTPQYMAPEQARGEAVDHRADLFSLGSVLYVLCTGPAAFPRR